MKNRKAQAKVLLLIIGVVALVVVLFGTITGSIISGGENSLNKKLPIEISNLKEFSEENLNSYESYEKFANSFNNMITILDNQKMFDIPKMNINQESYDKTLKFLTEYGPLVNNYNEVIESAKKYNLTRLDEDLKYFYGKASNFALELILIEGAVFYGPSYNTVGKVYRASGLQTLAFKCGGCVKVALSTAHWTMRNGLVELSSQFAKAIDDEPKGKWDSITLDSLMKKGNTFLDKTQEVANKTLAEVKNYNYTEAGKNLANKTETFLGGIFNK
ncbi:hypothetical protein K0A97_03145 [Patescibacteria group bacterium]|nr:hypothetical protein [Patescibacteria group bacterium]